MLDANAINSALEKLNYVDIGTRTHCLEDTRVSILADLKSWAFTDEQPVCWLYGPVGAGKSTIAATIAFQLRKDNRLAAFYTCKGDEKLGQL